MGNKKETRLMHSKPFVILLALFIIVLSYVAYTEYTNMFNASMMKAAQLGYEQGMVDVVSMIHEETEGCMIVPVMLGNVTKELVDVTCLNLDHNVTY